MTQAGLQVISASDTEYSRFIRIIDFEGPISNFKISLIITKAGVRLSMNNHDCSGAGSGFRCAQNTHRPNPITEGNFYNNKRNLETM